MEINEIFSSCLTKTSLCFTLKVTEMCSKSNFELAAAHSHVAAVGILTLFLHYAVN